MLLVLACLLIGAVSGFNMPWVCFREFGLFVPKRVWMSVFDVAFSFPIQFVQSSVFRI